MQNTLRDLLEQKIAMQGGDYYYDMSGDSYAGDLVAGGRRRKRRGGRKPAHMVKGSAAAKRHMAKVRRGRGGDFVDLNDLAGAGKRGKRIQKHYSPGGYRNPIQQAERDFYKEEKNKKWLITEGPAYSAKLQRKAAMIDAALKQTGMYGVGESYNTSYNDALQSLSSYVPYANASRKMGIKTQPIPIEYNTDTYKNALKEAAKRQYEQYGNKYRLP